MNRTDKEIYNEVEKNLNGFSDKKDENYKKITDVYFPKRKKNNNKLIWVLTSVSSIVIAISLLFVFVIIPNNSATAGNSADNSISGIISNSDSNVVTGDSGKKYYSDNEEIADSNIDELSEYFGAFKFIIDQEKTYNIDRIYDSETNDTLLFKIFINDATIRLAINYITNLYYSSTINKDNIILTKQYQGIDVAYNYSYERPNMVVYAYFEKDGQSIEVDFSMRTFDDSEQQFWDYIENFIIVN